MTLLHQLKDFKLGPQVILAALLIDAAGVSILIGIIALVASQNTAVIEYGFAGSYWQAGSLACGLGFVTLILATPIFALSILQQVVGGGGV